LVGPISAGSIRFTDNNLVQGYSIDLYNFTAGDTSFVTSWNSTVVVPINLDPNTSYIGVIRQNQVARFNNMNQLGADALDWITANFVGLFFLGIILAFISLRR
jgi:hypothetical protein